MNRHTLQEIDAKLHKHLPAFWRFIKYRFNRGEEYGLGFTISFALIVGALWLFLLIEDSVADQGTVYHLDFWIQDVIAQVLTPEMTERVILLTSLGNTSSIIVGVILMSAVLITLRRWWSFFGLVFATAGGGAILLGLKLFFSRARPAEQLIPAGGYAFPSGHAFGATVFFGYIIYLTWKMTRSASLRILVTIVSTALILAIGSSRIYLNVHWLTDVLGGFIAGFAWLLCSIEILKLVERRHVKQEKIKYVPKQK